MSWGPLMSFSGPKVVLVRPLRLSQHLSPRSQNVLRSKISNSLSIIISITLSPITCAMEANSLPADKSATSNENHWKDKPTLPTLPFNIKCLIFHILLCHDAAIEIIPTNGSGYMLYDPARMNKGIKKDIQTWWSTKAQRVHVSRNALFDQKMTTFFLDHRSETADSSMYRKPKLSSIRRSKSVHLDIRHLRIYLWPSCWTIGKWTI